MQSVADIQSQSTGPLELNTRLEALERTLEQIVSTVDQTSLDVQNLDRKTTRQAVSTEEAKSYTLAAQEFLQHVGTQSMLGIMSGAVRMHLTARLK